MVSFLFIEYGAIKASRSNSNPPSSNLRSLAYCARRSSLFSGLDNMPSVSTSVSMSSASVSLPVVFPEGGGSGVASRFLLFPFLVGCSFFSSFCLPLAACLPLRPPPLFVVSSSSSFSSASFASTACRTAFAFSNEANRCKYLTAHLSMPFMELPRGISGVFGSKLTRNISSSSLLLSSPYPVTSVNGVLTFVGGVDRAEFVLVFAPPSSLFGVCGSLPPPPPPPAAAALTAARCNL